MEGYNCKPMRTSSFKAVVTTTIRPPFGSRSEITQRRFENATGACDLELLLMLEMGMSVTGARENNNTKF